MTARLVSLSPGVEASVLFPTRKTHQRVRFLRYERDGSLTFVDRYGKLRSVHPEAVRTVHRKKSEMR